MTATRGAATDTGQTAMPSSPSPSASPPSPSAPDGCRVRSVLDRIGDKWAIYVVDRLGAGPRRFSELNRGIDGITARMLTVTLRGLERDGILTRTVHASVPPRVDYELTPLGQTLRGAICQLVSWAGDHIEEIEAARAGYDSACYGATGSPSSHLTPRA
ncbi:MAG TPA: helix-turn-helix domain-containing protein [Trebonia sp.]|jgi:DNA-binding HxlR family transcriptional regulator|nr:helix-turn-helix domain-containing protein [Trebonia sp.]